VVVGTLRESGGVGRDDPVCRGDGRRALASAPVDVVIRTPHGDAEVRVAPVSPSTRLADVVEAVTGRVAPPVVDVDGRAVPATTSLHEAGVLVGSVIDVGAPGAATAEGAVIDIVQQAGWGTGTRAPLAPGTYRIGPGRRVNASELHQAPVDSVAVELEVAADGSVTVTPDHRTLRVDGIALERGSRARWTRGVLDVAGRAFTVEPHDGVPPARPRPTTSSGTASFNRPPLSAVPPEGTVREPELARPPEPRPRRAPRANGVAHTRTIEPTPEQLDRRRATTNPADAVTDAVRVAPHLWRHRVGRPGALQLALGIGDDPGSGAGATSAVPITVDLASEQGVALVGTTDFVRAAARAAIVSLCAAHGPSDVAVVVATHPDRLAVWEWVKWLPHARTLGTIDVLATPDAVAAAVVAESRPSRVVVVVTDEPAWWRDRAAPLRPVLADSRSGMRMVALVADASDAPTICTTLLTEAVRDGAHESHDTAMVDHLLQRRCTSGVIPYLLGADLALTAARALAGLDDPDLPEPAADPAHRRSALGELVADLVTTDRVPTIAPGHLATAIAGHWRDAGPDGGLAVPLGRDGRTPVTLALGGDQRHLVLAGPEAPDVLRGALAAAAAAEGPDTLTFVLVGPATTFGPCGELPHVVGRVAAADPHDAARAVRCLRAEVRRRSAGGPTPRLLLVLDEPSARDVAGLTDAVLDIARRGAGFGLHLVVATDRPADVFDAALDPDGVAHLDVASRIGELTTRPMARSSLRLAGGAPRPLDPVTSRTVRTVSLDAGSLPDVAPFVIGRELTALERRLARGAQRDAGGGAQDLDTVIEAIERATRESQRRPARVVVPDPLPDRIELEVLLRAHPGDAVPWALADLPDEQRQAPRWWFPSAGPPANVLVTGARGGATVWPILTLALGIAGRASADDVHLYVVGSHAALAHLGALPHVGALVDVADVERVVELITFLASEVDRRRRAAREPGGEDHVLREFPGIAVLVDDLGDIRARLRSRADLVDSWRDLEAVLRHGAPVGVNVVATLRELDEVPPGTEAAFASRFVASTGSGSPAGRALELGEHSCDVQIAEPPADVAAAIAALGAEPARLRPPVRDLAAGAVDWRRPERDEDAGGVAT
jgi:S-DNA-T family DNA segregation ATPase FtsK/SpoIIIE